MLSPERVTRRIRSRADEVAGGGLAHTGYCGARYILEAPIPNGDLTFTIDQRLVIAGSDGETSETFALRCTMETTDPLAIDNVTCNGPTDEPMVATAGR